MKNKQIYLVAVVMVSFLIVGCSADSGASDPLPTPTNEVPSPVEEQPTPTVEETPTPTVGQTTDETNSLSGEGLLSFNNNPEDLVGETRNMTLYLEQSPFGGQADFMIFENTSRSDNTIVVCSMSGEDESMLDAKAAMMREAPEYRLEVTFTGFDDALTPPFYEAECKLI